MMDPKKTFWDDALDILEGNDEIEQEHVSLDELADEEFEEHNYVEGIDNWEDWN